jgi:exonuclease III
MPTDPERCAKREAQALVMQDTIINYIKKDYEIIFIGDLNDYDKDILDMNNNKPTSQVLDILKGTFIDDYTLYSVADHINKTERYTNWWDSEDNCEDLKQNYAMIDHILTTKYLQDKIKNAFIYQGYKEYCGKMDSDHYPIVVDFDFSN